MQEVRRQHLHVFINYCFTPDLVHLRHKSMVSRLFSRQLPIEQEHLVCHRAAQDPELLLVEYSFLLYSVEPYFKHFTELTRGSHGSIDPDFCVENRFETFYETGYHSCLCFHIEYHLEWLFSDNLSSKESGGGYLGKVFDEQASGVSARAVNGTWKVAVSDA